MIVGNFRFEDDSYLLTLFPNEDDRVEVRNSNDDLILIFTANCYIQKDGINIGYLSQNRHDNICYSFDLERFSQELDTNINAYKIDAYFEAEIIISKFYLENMYQK